jgi:UDP-N-acetyl-D-galactosamine dehydrogenase
MTSLNSSLLSSSRLAVIGCGYIGLPLILAFAKAGWDVIGYDTDEQKITRLQSLEDSTGECSSELQELEHIENLRFTSDLEDLLNCNVYIIAVPTPVDPLNRPDLSFVETAASSVGNIILKGSIRDPLIILESTVFPGVTENVVAKTVNNMLVDRAKTFSIDYGYSPERLSPGRDAKKLPDIAKVISSSSENGLSKMKVLYGSIIRAQIFSARSIKVAEAAKALENTQRDLNIALVNELSHVFARDGISVNDVIDAASTKWNFMPVRPGLVGGHCIGVDPYYLTEYAQRLGYHPEIVLAGRRVNDGMAVWLAKEIMLRFFKSFHADAPRKILVLGATFKANCADFRNSKTRLLIDFFLGSSFAVHVCDPYICSSADLRIGSLPSSASWYTGLADLLPVVDLSEKFPLVFVSCDHDEFKRDINLLDSILSESAIGYDIPRLFDCLCPGSFPGVGTL